MSEGAGQAAEWLECVPNVSAGRDPALLADLCAAATEAGATVLDASRDVDHNRSVLTFAGPPPAVEAAAFAVAALAVERVDLRAHEGVHPRIGALDVLPFVPLASAQTPTAVAAARRVGQRLGAELELPVYFYGAAAARPGRQALPALRRGGFEGLRAAVAAGDPERRPDAGPVAALHASAGATAVGVRPFLIAFNVDLESDDLELARSIARQVRESGGGLPGIRALGLHLQERGVVQVSLNVTDHGRTGLRTVFERIAALAAEAGVRVRSSELIGLAPAAALDAEVARAVALPDFDPERQVLEVRLATAQAAREAGESR